MSYDGRTHVLRLGALQRAVAEGVFLPRWLGEMQLGHGYPLFLFYPIGGYYLALLPALAGLPLDYAFNLALAAVILIAAAGAWFLGRDVFHGNSLAALVAAVAYTFAPYLLVNVYLRGALPEALGQALLPWVVWTGRRVATKPQPASYALLMASLLAGLMLTHSLLLMLFVPYLLIYLGILWWQAGRSRRTLGWLASALAVAAGVSAFFWLPMLANRQYLTDAGYHMAQLGWLPDNVWTWQNFLDWRLFYEHTNVHPAQLGLLQAGLALGGFILARRRDGEWLFFCVAAFVSCLLIGSWALPFWLSSDVLAAVQFPWRLLSLVSLSCAMLTGGLVCWPQPVRHQRMLGLVAVATVTLIVAVQSPRGLEFYPQMGNALGAASLAAHEVEKGVLTADAASSVQEFRPRWSLVDAAQAKTVFAAIRPSQQATNPATIGDLSTGPGVLAMQVQAPVTTTLRFQDYYYPSWRITGPAGSALPTYASGELGLLTVDLPPGRYRLEKRWSAPPWAQAGTVLTFATFALLVVLYALYRRSWWALLPAVLLAAGLAGWAHIPAMSAVPAPQETLNGLGLQLRGYVVVPAGSGPTVVRLYWYVTGSPPTDLRLRVQLRNTSGRIVQEYVQRPYFNQASADGWSPGLLVEDALQVALPQGVSAGTYTLALGLEAYGADQTDGQTFRPKAVPPVGIGEVYVHATPGLRLSDDTDGIARFGSVATLAAAEIISGGTAIVGSDGRPPVVAPGQAVCIDLKWRPLVASTLDLRGFVHLVDAQAALVVHRDQVPGPDFWPASLWLPGVPRMDEYCIQIPATAMSGVVWPEVGLYKRATVDRLAVTGMHGQDGSAVADHVVLAPLKIVRKQSVAWPLHPAVSYGEVAELAGAKIELPAEGVSPGSAITVTLGWHSVAPTSADLTRFVHLYSPELGLAAQADGIPQAGLNPTWSWAAGEQIVDQVVLTVPEAAAPGQYRLAVGFYDQAADNARIAAVDADGNRLTDDLAQIGEIQVVKSEP